MQSHILIRAAVGPQVGTGHVMRSAALASSFIQLGGEVTMLCSRQLPAALRHRLERLGICVEMLDRENLTEDAIHTRRRVEDFQSDWIVLDGYEFDDDYQRVLKLSLAKLLVIDDYQHASHRYADLILNQNLYANQGTYSNGADQRLLLGSRFVLMRDEFARLEPISNKVPKQVKRVLLTFGGADEGNLTQTCLQALSKISGSNDLSVDAVVGACNPHWESLKQETRNCPFTVRLHRNVDRMSAIIGQCHLAVTAGGSTCYELARCGIPSMVISSAANQRPVAKAFEELECMRWLGDSSGITIDSLATTIKELMVDHSLRCKMSRRGAQVVDGQGSGRVARRLYGNQFELRAVQSSDAKLIWDWRNETAVRSVSFQSNEIGWEEHLAWFSRVLSERQTDLWIVENEDGPVGQVRFDFEGYSTEATISVSLDSAVRGKGWGTTIIESACLQTFVNEDVDQIIALIKPENQASIGAFSKAGFRNDDSIKLYGQSATKMVLDREVLLPLDGIGTNTWKRSA